MKETITDREIFEIPVVMNAAGPHAGLIGKMIGLDISILPAKRHIFITGTSYHTESGPSPSGKNFR